MKQEGNSVKYKKVFDKRKKLFGIKIEGQKDWYVAPCFEELGCREYGRESKEVWFKQNGKYGWYNIQDRCVVLPAIYGYPLFFGSREGNVVAWKDYKAGVIDYQGNIVIPFIYDEIDSRIQWEPIPEEERRTVTMEDGTVRHVGPQNRSVFHGYACFTNEGDEQAYDENGHPEAFQDWEKDRLNRKPEYDNPEVESMSLADLEELIRKEYVKLVDLGYDSRHKWRLSQEQRDKVDKQKDRVKSLVMDRRTIMNRGWVHNVESAKRIGRTNNLLMRAVRKAIRLGEKTSKSLRWMEKVSNQESYEVTVCVLPKWEDSKSDLRYKPKYKSATKEKDRLIDEEDNVANTHIWNIIAALGGCYKHDGIGACFAQWSDEYTSGYWDERKMTMDDGQSWDEYLHFPAYQDEYFTHPFYELSNPTFGYSYEDLCNINDFRVVVNVELEAKERDSRRLIGMFKSIMDKKR